MGNARRDDDEDLSSFYITVVHIVIIGLLVVGLAIAATCSDARGRMQWHAFCYRWKAYVRGNAGPAYSKVCVSDGTAHTAMRQISSRGGVVPRFSSSSSSSGKRGDVIGRLNKSAARAGAKHSSKSKGRPLQPESSSSSSDDSYEGMAQQAQNKRKPAPHSERRTKKGGKRRVRAEMDSEESDDSSDGDN